MTIDVRLEKSPLALNIDPDNSVVAFVRDADLRGLTIKCLGAAAVPAATDEDAPEGANWGGVDLAIRYLMHDPSPRHVLIDLVGVAEPLAALDRLAEVCLPGTRVIALGDVNDVHFYQTLRAAGVAEYLVKPISEDQLRSALQPRQSAPAPAPAPAAMPQTGNGPIVVVGARGGVGATMVAVSLAWIAADQGGQRTVLIDLDLAGGTTGLALDVEAGRGLAEALATPDRIDGLLLSSATVKINKNLSLLSSEHPLESRRQPAADAVPMLAQGLQQNFQRTIFDIPRTEPELLCQVFEDADAIVIVTDFSLAGMRDTLRLLGLAKKLAPKAKHLVVGNRLGVAKKGGLIAAECEKTMGVKFAAVIAEDANAVPQALGAGKALPAAFPSCAASLALREVAEKLGCISKPAGRGWLDKMFGFGPPKGSHS